MRFNLPIIVTVLVGCDIVSQAPPQFVPIQPEGAIVASVYRVIDGDTIVIIQDGEEQE